MASTFTYCVYVTTYSGNKMPLFYIGSSNTSRISAGYRGTVSSKSYKQIWKEELKTNPHLFNTEIISLHSTRIEATTAERQLQKHNNAARSDWFINKSLAVINHAIGAVLCGSENGNFGNKWSLAQREVARQRSLKQHAEIGKTQFMSNVSLQVSRQIPVLLIDNHLEAGWVIGRLFMNTEKHAEAMRRTFSGKKLIRCSCIVCKKNVPSRDIGWHYTQHGKYEYFGDRFDSLEDLHAKTGCSGYNYRKYYKQGIDPRPFIGRGSRKPSYQSTKN